MQHNTQNMVLLCQASSCDNLLPPVELDTYFSLPSPVKNNCVYHIDPFTVIVQFAKKVSEEEVY